MAGTNNIFFLSDESKPMPSFQEINPSAQPVADEPPPESVPTLSQLFPALEGFVENERAPFEAIFPSLDSFIGGRTDGDVALQPNEAARAEIGAAHPSSVEPDSSSRAVAAPVVIFIPR